MILAGDIGGTKTVLALYSKNSQGKMQCACEQTFASNDYPHFDDILSVFITAEQTYPGLSMLKSFLKSSTPPR